MASMIGHWSSTISENDTNRAWVVSLYNAVVPTQPRTSLYPVICVRGGSGFNAR